jgi:hypothetical protein
MTRGTEDAAASPDGAAVADATTPSDAGTTPSSDDAADAVDGVDAAGEGGATPKGSLGWAAPVTYGVGASADPFVPNDAPINVATGDFNRDGKPDLVVLHTSDNTINVMLNRGDGTFLPPVSYAAGTPVNQMFLGDFNGDGKVDVGLPGGATASNNATANPVVFLGNGDGTFKAPISSSSFGATRGVAIGDFNGDGKLDFVANNPTQGTVTVTLGNGDGSFKAGVVSPPASSFGYSRWVSAGDFNGDNKLDLVIADGVGTMNEVGTAEITTLIGKGDGTFTLGAHYPSPPTASSWSGSPAPVGTGPVVNPEDAFAVDVNNDGKLDIIESLYDHNINVFMGNGDGTFQAAVGYVTGEYPRCVAVADLDGDGLVDLVVNNVGCAPNTANCGTAPGSVAVMLGNGGGTFQAPVRMTPFTYPEWLVVADLNGDRRPDIAVTRVDDGHSVDVIVNTP